MTHAHLRFYLKNLLYLLLCPKRGVIGGIILLAGRCHSLRDVEGATGQGASLASASGPPLHLLSAGRRLSLRDVEGAAGRGASLTSANGPPLHLVQLAAAAALVEARSR